MSGPASSPATPFVVASHPSRQGFFYRVPLAAQRGGLPGAFLTGLYYRPDRLSWRLAERVPGLGRKLPLRRLPELDDARVEAVSGPWPELLVRLLPTAAAANALHDAAAARWLRRRLAAAPGPVIVHGAIGSCRDLFRAAQRLGMRRVLEVTSPPGAAAETAEAVAAWGLPPPRTLPLDREREEVSLADMLLVQNRFSRDLLLRAGAPPERLRLLPLGVDLARFRPRLGPRAPGPLRVLYVGQISAAKGLPVLLEAWRRLAPANATLSLVGAVVDSSGPKILQRYAGAYDYPGRLAQPALCATYAQADLFVMPSLFEGGPMVVLEAMASGLPCVVSTAAASVVEHEADGLIVPTGQVDALAAAIGRLLDDEPLRLRMGEAARRNVEAFGWDAHGDRLCRIYRALAAGEPVPQEVLLP